MKTPQAVFLNARVIIEKTENGVKYVLIQRRIVKQERYLGENGSYEFPGGCIEMGETIIDAIKREVLEETGLTVTKIRGTENYSHCDGDIETVVPFTAYQKVGNWMGPNGEQYKSVGFHFVCEAEGELLEKGDDSDSIQWVTLAKLQAILDMPGMFGGGIDAGAARIYLSQTNK
ncbi:MAG: NUDIX domain-containing protein [Defluviitaleaceae bacterium]|nr:NUDIX domain-containing protein [Defluviitaleaceae bacterium]MCL2240098.1 NUDIX domain-containing protein [Defluviitaleaceae bacterium]